MKPEQQTLFDLPIIAGSKQPKFKPVRNRIWTEQKAKLISRYLRRFVLITKHGTYIDGFAGPQYNDKEDAWTSRLVLESEPRWLKSFFLCDIDANQVARLNAMVSGQPAKPKRHVEVLAGDFNQNIHTVLQSNKIREGVATFCLLDQRTFECDWSTVQTLAQAKKSEKIELMYFVPTGWFERAVSGLNDKSRVERWWGRSDWQQLTEMNKDVRALAFCDRFKKELGYKYTSHWPIYDKEGGTGRIMYHLIHASDHRDAPYLMSRAYRTATKSLPPQEQLVLEFAELKKALDEVGVRK